MKCTEAEKQILLRDSGERSDQHGGALAAHLHDCNACRRFQHALMEARNTTQASEEPSETILNNVKREARRRAPEQKKAIFIYWKPALAMAASVMIVLGLLFSPDRVGLELVMSDTELLDIQEQAISVMYSSLSEDDLAFNFLMTYEES
jgi:predicted anti-sigma-YlaC factor YlaD